MPYQIRKNPNPAKHDWLLVKEGKVVSHHKTRAKARAAIRAIEASKHGVVMRHR
jgi:hypothetical protein